MCVAYLLLSDFLLIWIFSVGLLSYLILVVWTWSSWYRFARCTTAVAVGKCIQLQKWKLFIRYYFDVVQLKEDTEIWPFVWIQRHQQHMHTLLLQDSRSLLTWRLVLIQLHWEVPGVAVQGDQCLAFLLSKWKKKKACSSVELVIWWSFTFSWDVLLVNFLNWDIGIQLENWFHCFFQHPSENQQHCRWEFFDRTKFWRLLFLLSFWHRQEREVFVAHELHLCILYTFFEANMLLTGNDGAFFTHLETITFIGFKGFKGLYWAISWFR